MNLDKKLDRLTWRISKLRHKIYKQEALLANYQIYGKTPPGFYVTNLVNWQVKLKQLQQLKEYYIKERDS